MPRKSTQTPRPYDLVQRQFIKHAGRNFKNTGHHPIGHRRADLRTFRVGRVHFLEGRSTADGFVMDGRKYFPNLGRGLPFS